MGRLDGKVAFITGIAKGQGRSHAVTLASEGADIIGVDVCEQIPTHSAPCGTEQDLAETVRLVEALGRRIIVGKADVRDEAAIAAVVDSAVLDFGRLDIVVANAGIGMYGTPFAVTDEQWDATVDVDLKGVWHTARVGARHIISGGRGGSIVMTGSVGGLRAFRNVIAYTAAKHGVVGLMKALAIEWGAHSIRVNAVHPTQVNTDMIMNDEVIGLFCPDIENPTVDDFAPRSAAMHVLPTPWVEPEDVAKAVLFLVSDDARFITGVSLPVDAGSELIN